MCFTSVPHYFGAPSEELLRVPSDSSLQATGYRCRYRCRRELVCSLTHYFMRESFSLIGLHKGNVY